MAELGPLLESLRAKSLVVYLTPPGRGAVVTHNLYQPRELDKVRREHGVAMPVDAHPVPSPASGPQPAPPSGALRPTPAAAPTPAATASPAAADEIQHLRNEVAHLRTALAALRDEAETSIEQLKHQLEDLNRQLGN